MASLGLLCGPVVTGIAVLLALVDVRTGRGYVLATLSSLHLAITVVVVGTVAIAAQNQTQPISRQNVNVTILLVFYFIPAVFAMVGIVIGASIVAGIAHRWLWIVGFIVAAVVPFLVGALPYSLWDLNTEFIVRNIGFLAVLVAPMVTVLAYSITRLVHPVTSTPSHQPAPIG